MDRVHGPLLKTEWAPQAVGDYSISTGIILALMNFKNLKEICRMCNPFRTR